MTGLHRRLVSMLAIALAAAQAPDSPGPAPGSGYAIRWHAGDRSDSSWVEVAGIDAANLAALSRLEWTPAQWSSLLSVRVASDHASGETAASPILGTYRVRGEALQFQPRFAWDPGTPYQARFQPRFLPRGGGDRTENLTAAFMRPRPHRTERTYVVRVDPTDDRLPENLLKFYLHFSRPMSRGEAYARVNLLDASGRKVETPFLELEEELWNRSGTRLTLVLDPGRVKRGLKPREEAGPILESGRAYTLVVDPAWPDAEGSPLRETYRKPFRAGPADETRPDPRNWKVDAPRAGSDHLLQVTFPEPLDRAMLDHVLEVHGPDGRPVAGRVDVDAAGTHWSFRPDHPWRAGRYRLAVDAALEDRAGNSIARLFEIDVFRPVTREVVPETASIPFEIGGDDD